MNHWLFKTEPSTYSFADLVRDKRTAWNGIRNFQARNFLKQTRKGDLVLIYHSGDDKAVVGVAKILAEPYPEIDPTDPKGEWVQVDLSAVSSLKNPVALAEIKTTAKLKGLLMLKQSRLSAMPVSKAEFELISRLGEKKAGK
ncbi:MAG: EVE domain-containing protein [Bacteriovoracia bacterium]